MRIIYFAIVLFNYSFAQANSLDTFSDEFFSLDDNSAGYNGSHLFLTSNFNVDLVSDKIKAADVLSLEVDRLEGKDDKINIAIGNSLLNKSSFDLGFSKEWAKEPLFELGYKAVTTSKNSTFLYN